MNKENECILVQENIVCFSDDLTNNDRGKKWNIALKLNHQFSHPNMQKRISLLKDTNIDDKELIAITNDVSDNCEICFKYKKPQPRPTLGFPQQNFSMKP